MKKILITAFEPFDNQKENSSLEVIKSLGLNYKVLPVLYQKEIYEKLLLEEKPDILLLCGQAGGRDSITIEQVAINMQYSKTKDNNGVIKLGEKIIEEGKDAYFATIPSLEIVERLEAKNLPVKLSLSAGGYICNLSFYASLYYAEKYGLDTKIGFIHFPYYEGQSNIKNMPTLSLDIQTKVMKEILKIIS